MKRGVSLLLKPFLPAAGASPNAFVALTVYERLHSPQLHSMPLSAVRAQWHHRLCRTAGVVARTGTCRALCGPAGASCGENGEEGESPKGWIGEGGEWQSKRRVGEVLFGGGKGSEIKEGERVLVVDARGRKYVIQMQVCILYVLVSYSPVKHFVGLNMYASFSDSRGEGAAAV